MIFNAKSVENKFQSNMNNPFYQIGVDLSYFPMMLHKIGQLDVSKNTKIAFTEYFIERKGAQVQKLARFYYNYRNYLNQSTKISKVEYIMLFFSCCEIWAMIEQIKEEYAKATNDNNNLLLVLRLLYSGLIEKSDFDTLNTINKYKSEILNEPFIEAEIQFFNENEEYKRTTKGCIPINSINAKLYSNNGVNGGVSFISFVTYIKEPTNYSAYIDNKSFLYTLPGDLNWENEEFVSVKKSEFVNLSMFYVLLHNRYIDMKNFIESAKKSMIEHLSNINTYKDKALTTLLKPIEALANENSILIKKNEELLQKYNSKIEENRTAINSLSTEYENKLINLKNKLENEKNEIAIKLNKTISEEKAKYAMKEMEIQNLEAINLKIRQELTEEVVLEKILESNVISTGPNNWDRTFFEQFSLRLEQLDKIEDSLRQKEYLSEIKEWVNESKINLSLIKTENERIEFSTYKTQLEIENRIIKEEVNREKDLLKIETIELKIDRKLMEAQFLKIQTELNEQFLSMREFTLLKDIEYKQFEITQKESIVKIGEMINVNEAKNLQGERQKIEVAQKIAEIGMQVREQNQQLQKQLNDIEKYNIKNEQQLLEINKGKADIQNILFQAKNEYQKNQNEIREKLMEIKDIKFQNEVSSILLELNKKHFENDIQLQNLGLVQRENEAMLKGRENDIRSIYLTNQSVVNNLLSLQKENRLHAQIEAERQSQYNLEQNLQSRIWSLQNSLERSQIELTSERALKKYLQQ